MLFCYLCFGLLSNCHIGFKNYHMWYYDCLINGANSSIHVPAKNLTARYVKTSKRHFFFLILNNVDVATCHYATSALFKIQKKKKKKKKGKKREEKRR
jgi:hypothetical protein